MENKYKLRWRFDFADKAAYKAGQWSQPATQTGDMASVINKTGLVRAAIEGKCLQTLQVVVLAECDGWDFVNFQWMAAMRMGLNGRVRDPHMLRGIRLITRDLNMEVLLNGDIQIQPRTPVQLSTQFEQHAK